MGKFDVFRIILLKVMVKLMLMDIIFSGVPYGPQSTKIPKKWYKLHLITFISLYCLLALIYTMLHLLLCV